MMKNAFLETRRQTRNKQTRSKELCQIVNQSKGKKYLLVQINNFIKKKDFDFFNLVKYWFISANDISVIPFNFVFRTQLIPIIQTHLLDYNSLPSSEILVSILRIISVLTAPEAPTNNFFSSPDVLSTFAELLTKNDENITKFTLLILSQLCIKFPELIQFIHQINLPSQLLSLYLLSPNEDISGISSFFLCQIACYSSIERSAEIIIALLNFVQNGNIKAATMLFKGIVFHFPLSPQFSDVIIQCNFCGFISQFLPKLNQNHLEIISLIFNSLSLVVTNEDGLSSFITSNLIALISQLDLIQPSINCDVFNDLTQLLCNLIVNENGDIDSQIINAQIIEKMCVCSNLCEYDSKIKTFGFLSFIIQKKNKIMCQIIAENNGIVPFFELFDTFSDEMVALSLQTLIIFINILPEAKILFDQFDFDLFIQTVDQFEIPELSEQAQVLLSLVTSC
ncbi:hypothetical protein TRFO_35776 [Tritrichomonas foetus]|uniref:IBB domain-containing protein n=1 Tax=Tritrichomonas foetus TaxID=1144522 RepID=A0A1J4JI14_9EUKA|nr:hypothetical protein TRFO_35776 [Tritrichomonas foetus]|eukprot:OHS97903.1 hypothetical protein TRFO_35776 [Tritrichomonas foetus]